MGLLDGEETNLKKRKQNEEKEKRDQLRYMAKRIREREQRLDFAGQKKSKEVRDRERDVSER